jgi:hypothetical protein
METHQLSGSKLAKENVCDETKKNGEKIALLPVLLSILEPYAISKLCPISSSVHMTKKSTISPVAGSMMLPR